MRKLYAHITYFLLTVVGISACLWIRTGEPTADPELAGFAGGWLETASEVVAYLTSPTALIVVSLLFAFLAVETHHVHGWLHISAGLFVGAMISFVLKEMLQIPRPQTSIDLISGFGFPSTHAVAGSTLTVLVSYHIHRIWNADKAYLYPAATAAVFIVAVSRVILGVHTVTDVIAGSILGLYIGYIFVCLWDRWHAFLSKHFQHQLPTI